MAITNVTVQSTALTRLFLAVGEQAVTTMFFCNQSTLSDCLIDIYVVPAGKAVSSASQIIKSLPLVKTETFVFDAEKLILEPDDSIWAMSTVDQIVIATISSVRTS